MLVPLSWLKKYVKIDLSVEEFVRRMIMSGTAVEGYEDCGAEISNVVVGKLVEIVKHPNSDHLNVCQVDVGGETPIQIVTGADNMSVGDLVPVALHDSHLPGGVHITPRQAARRSVQRHDVLRCRTGRAGGGLSFHIVRARSCSYSRAI